MGKSRVKGIVVEIGGDTVGLDKALQNTNKQIGHTQNQLKDVERLLKLDPKNTVLLEQKQKLLAQTIAETKEKLQTLNQANDQLRSDVGKPVSTEQFDALQREIAETQARLDALTEKQKNFGSVTLQVMKEAGDKVSAFGDKVVETGEKVSKLGTKLSLTLTPAITSAGTTAVIAGTDLIENQNKVEVAFGESADSIMAFAETTLDSYGIAKGSALDMAALFGDMATSMGIPQNAAAEMSESLVGLAGDLASFKNEDLDTVQTALKGIFTGETESLKNLGVVMNQDILLQYAMEQGMIDIKKTTEQLAKEKLALAQAELEYEKAVEDHAEAVEKYGENSLKAREALLDIEEAAFGVTDAQKSLNESAKASLDSLSQAELIQLRYAYVLDATANAHGDFARTSDGAANSMRMVSEATEEMAAEFGVLLAPFVAECAQMITDLLKTISELPEAEKKNIIQISALLAILGPALIVGGKVITGMGKFVSLIGAIPDLLIKLSGSFGTLTRTVLPGLGTAFSSVFGFIAANPVVLLIGAIVGLVALVATKSEACIEYLNAVDNFLQAVFAVDWTEIFGPVLGGALNDFFAMCQDIWDGVKLMLEGIIDFVAGVFSGDWERAWEGVRKIFTGIFDSLEGLLKAPINGVIKMVNKAIDGINWLIKGVNKIPGVNLGTIGQIPMLANGGEVIQGNAIVGDGGPELLTVLPDRTVVQPLTNNYHSTARNVGSINVSVYGAPGQDVRELAEAVAEEMQYLYESEDAGWR